MDQNLLEIKADLIDGHTTIPIDVIDTSKYSLLIQLPGTNNVRHGKEFSNLILRRNGSRFELGRCRFLSEPKGNGSAGSIICTNDIYDIESLLADDRMIILQNACLNLPLLLALKNRISPTFKKFTANLTYDMSLYKDIFDGLDAEYANEPANIRSALQETVIHTIGTQFTDFLDEKLNELETIVKPFSKQENEDHGFYFRKQIWNMIKASPFMARTNHKPRGYAGDSEMMRMIYANDYWGESTFAKLLHKHPLDQPASRAVRNRRRYITKLINDRKRELCDKNCAPLRVLSVACGPACEIQDILLDAADCSKLQLVMLDQDQSALDEAAKLIAEIETRMHANISVEFLNDSVRTMLASSGLKEKMGQFDLIYSMGLFDYLTPPVASRVLGKLYDLLIPGGEMTIGNFHASNPSKYYMEYWLDWVLYYRTEEEFKSLLWNSKFKETNVTYDDSGVQMFLHVVKNGVAA